ncbi:MAG: extracellular solute-binding protein [Clostridiales bacterium]|nr:extracellular solute-binding protein [Clostridiales bacterium]
MKKRVLALACACLLALGAFGGAAFALEKEDVTIMFLGSNSSVDLNTDYVASLLEENTGFKVQYDQLPSTNADERLMMEVAAGTSYDLLALSTTQYQMLLGQGALMPLDDLLEKYPNVKANIKEVGWAYCTSTDGHIYGVPNVDDATFATDIGYRKDIFDQYGWTEPNTVDEFYQLLVDIKEQTGLIPLTGNEGFHAEIASGFGLSYSITIDENGQAQSYLRDPGMKEYLAFMNQLYTEGLIDVDWPVNTADTINQKISSGQAVMTRMSHWSPTPWYNALVETVPEVEFSNILPLSDENGEKVVAISDGVSRVFAIPAGTDPERADLVMQMIDARLSEEIYWLFNDGIEGTHYTMGEDGIPVPIQPIFEEDMNYGSEFQIGRNQFVHPTSWLCRVQKNPVQYAVFSDANTKVAAYPLTPDPMKFASYDALEQYSAALNKMCNDYFIAVIAGTESLDSYDEFVASWEAAGGLELEAGATEWYAANPDLVDAAMHSVSPYADLFGYQQGE